MRKYRGSHEDFDYFVIPTVPALKQQQDTIATLAELARIGIPPAKLRLVFNQVEDDTDVARGLRHVALLRRAAPARRRQSACRLGANEIYERVKGTGDDLAELAADATDYKAQIARATDTVREARAGAEARHPAPGLAGSSPSSTSASRRSS